MKIRFLTKSSSLTATSTVSFGRAYESRIFTLHFPLAKEKEGKMPLALKENAILRRLWERLILIIVKIFQPDTDFASTMLENGIPIHHALRTLTMCYPHQLQPKYESKADGSSLFCFTKTSTTDKADTI
ncbi:hypothetical protein I7I51_08791 [Histoplasma capsulatum]|uniref:Uncharacterized protein n=1 Tax=Ajellomyces capsulatus TaxID=5037 RepID=A0A8A1LYT9_AJECA|nr:hypothetical protein I7I51_08791 [Histoplasma capsulatum]